MATAPKGQPVTLVYAGKRAATGGKTGHMFYILNSDGTLGDKLFYGPLKGMGLRTIGGVYTGANYDPAEKVTYGLASMRYCGMHGDATALAGWEALDHEHDSVKAAVIAQRKYAPGYKVHLLPLRRTMDALRKRGQHAEANAYRDLILAELYRPVTKEEREDAAD